MSHLRLEFALLVWAAAMTYLAYAARRQYHLRLLEVNSAYLVSLRRSGM